MMWFSSPRERRLSRSRSLALSLCGAVLALLCSALPATAQLVSYDGLLGVDGNGDPALPGAGVTATEWYKPDSPLVVVNVPCPTSSVDITETKSSSTSWSLTAGAKAGVDWGVVSGELSTEFGVEIGEEHTISISKTVEADPYVGKEVRVYTRYQMKQYSVAGRTVSVLVPVGWYEKHSDTGPSCPCEDVEDAEDEVEKYGKTLDPGSRLSTQVAVVGQEIDHALAAFGEKPVDGLLTRVMTRLDDALLALERAREMGADPEVVESVGRKLTGTMDNIVVGRMADADSTHTLDRNELRRYNPFTADAYEAAFTARALAEDTAQGADRFVETSRLYAEAYHQSRAARTFTFSDLTVTSTCYQPSADATWPGDACPSTMTTTLEALDDALGDGR